MAPTMNPGHSRPDANCPTVRRLATVAFLLLASTTDVAYGGDSATAGRSPLAATARVDFAIRIPQILGLRTLKVPEVLRISPQEALAGELASELEAEVEITCNVRGGCLLRFDLLNPAIERVSIGGLGIPFEVGPGGAEMMLQRGAGRAAREVLRLTYRVHLSPGTTAGEHRWPIALNVGAG